MSARYSKDEVEVQSEPSRRSGNGADGGRVGCRSKSCVILYVVILWLASLVAIAGGVWSVADPRIVNLQLYQVFSDQLSTIPALMITCGVVSIATGIIAMIGAIKGDPKLYGVFICLILFLVVSWCGIGGYCASFTDTVKSSIATRFEQAAKYVDSTDPNTEYRAWMLSVAQYMPRCCTVVQLSLCARSCVPDYTELVWNYLMPTMYGLNFGMALVSILGVVVVAVSCAKREKRRSHYYY